MSERKVLQKYFPPDFDPSALSKRQKGPKQVGPKVIPVRLMAPFSMRCTSCGEFIYKGRKFNARKETAEEKYLSITIYRFHIKCTRCSGEIVFKTDPRNMDYVCERGAKRNFEPWREKKEDISDEQHLDNLEAMEAEEAEREQGDAMADLEERAKEAKNEMAIADALDSIRSRNARREENEKAGKEINLQEAIDWEKQRQEQEDEEAARMAFQTASGEKIRRLVPEDHEDSNGVNWANGNGIEDTSSFTFKKPARPKKDFATVLGVKMSTTPNVISPVVKPAATKPALAVAAAPKKPVLLAGYDSDSD